MLFPLCSSGMCECAGGLLARRLAPPLPVPVPPLWCLAPGSFRQFAPIDKRGPGATYGRSLVPVRAVQLLSAHETGRHGAGGGAYRAHGWPFLQFKLWSGLLRYCTLTQIALHVLKSRSLNYTSTMCTHNIHWAICVYLFLQGDLNVCMLMFQDV